MDSAVTFDCSIDLTLSNIKPLSLHAFERQKNEIELFTTSADEEGRGTKSKLYKTGDRGKTWQEVTFGM